MEKVDLTLVPIDELVQEIMKRSEEVVIGYTLLEDPGPPFIFINYEARNSWLSAVGLCEYIKQHIFDKRKEQMDG